MRYISLQFAFLITCCTQALLADITLPQIFSDHMVLQRDIPLPIWGTATPGEEVTVSIDKQELRTNASGQGAWRIRLASLGLGDLRTLTVRGKNTLVLKDVLVGEVWVGSGQSNMAGSVKGYAILFSFGVPIRRALDVPVGLMLGAGGGTPSGFWLTKDMYQGFAIAGVDMKVV